MQEIDTYQQAINCFYENKYTDAKNILKEIIEQNSSDFDAFNFLATIYLNEQNYQKAVDFFKKTLIIYEKHPSANYNLGLCYQRINNYKNAKKYYLKALELNYVKEDVLNNLGLVCTNLEDFQEANSYLTEAVNLFPWKHHLYYNLGNLSLKQKKYKEAVKYYKDAIDLDDSVFAYKLALANAFKESKDYQASINILNNVIKEDPYNYDAYEILGSLFLGKKEYQDADINFSKCLELLENKIQSFNTPDLSLGNSVDHSYRSTKINEVSSLDNPQSGNIADEIVENHLISNDDFKLLSTLTNLGLTKLEQGYFEEALELFYRANDVNNNITEIHYNLAHALLLLGKYEEGFNEYEWRLKRKEFGDKKFSKPYLENQTVKNKKILVYDEQGLGDSIQFIRYLKLLKNEGCYLIFQCDKRLFNLYQSFDYVDELITNEKKINFEYDYNVALLSLPRYFKINEKTIPHDFPYIDIKNNKTEKFSIFNDDPNLKVGIVWAGNPNHTGDFKRSCKLKDLEPIFELDGISFYSIQKGDAVNQLKDSSYPIQNMDLLINDFTDTAKIIKNLDLVISVDTSVAHLAGAMGKEVWLLLPLVPDWRWLIIGESTKWYPSMKLFRQKELYNWNPVMLSVKKALQNKIEGEKIKLITDNNISCSTEKKIKKLFLGLAKGENFGWGVCSKYLRIELRKLLHVQDLNEHYLKTNIITDKSFLALTDIDLNPLYHLNGKEKYGYTFFENELTEKSIENSKDFTKVIAGSTWCKQKLEDKGILNTDVLIQGIDPEIFYPGETAKKNDLFVIFSGGKLELRKGQDLVLKAVKILQEKYNDIILINAWYNFWPDSMAALKSSQFINFELKGNTWLEFMSNLYNINNIDADRIFTLPLVPNYKLRELYLKTDIGLFPNRCEGGTNLVLMEYMACGKPVVASFNSGHKDILTNDNSLRLEKMQSFKVYDNNNNLNADWEEPDLDEIIEKIEFAYQNREHIKNIGEKAALDMKNLTWKNTAENLIKILY